MEEIDVKIEMELATIQVRYDGLDAERHEIDLHEFGKSSLGVSKILATVADFIVTTNYQSDKRNLCCKVYIKEPKANCLSFMAIIHAIDDSSTLSSFSSTVSASIFLAVLAYVWGIISNKKEEMKALQESLNLAIKQLGRKEDTGRLIATIEKMALALIPAAQQAVSPIGNTCETIKFGQNNTYHTTLDRDDKAVINGEDFTVTPETDYKVLIDEFDMRRRSCKVALRDDLRTRYNAVIADPQAELANNKYALAMTKKSIVQVRAKTKISRGKIKEFVISDIDYEPAKE